MVFVTKADGSKQEFDREKIFRTCLRMRATKKQANEVVKRIERKVYDGIETKKILEMIFLYLKDYKPYFKNRIDLREAISLLRPKPDFEKFVALLLKEKGYGVESNQIIRGKCVEHEIDAIAKNDKEIIYIEVKHHFQPHTYTGVDVALEARATFEDLVDGFSQNYNNIDFNKAMVVCNTKFSDHAIHYMRCRNILYLGWNAPADGGLENMIEEKKLYPITLLKDLDRSDEERLADNSIILLRQLIEKDINEISKLTKISKNRLQNYISKAREILLD